MLPPGSAKPGGPGSPFSEEPNKFFQAKVKRYVLFYSVHLCAHSLHYAPSLSFVTSSLGVVVFNLGTSLKEFWRQIEKVFLPHSINSIIFETLIQNIGMLLLLVSCINTFFCQNLSESAKCISMRCLCLFRIIINLWKLFSSFI